MKYAHYDEKTGKLLGWYDKKIHKDIPKPYLEVSDEDWKEAIKNNFNYVDIENKTLGKKDFRSLDELKIVKKAEIENAYEDAIQKPIEFNGHTFQADNKSQNTITKIIVSALDTFKTEWLDINNIPITMTLEDLKALAQNIIDREQILFKKKINLKQQLKQATSKEEVEQIKFK